MFSKCPFPVFLDASWFSPQEAYWRAITLELRKIKKNINYYWLSRDHVFMQAAHDLARRQVGRRRDEAEFKDRSVPCFYAHQGKMVGA